MSSRARCLSADSRFSRAASALRGSDDGGGGGGGLLKFEGREREIDGAAEVAPEKRADSWWLMDVRGSFTDLRLSSRVLTEIQYRQVTMDT